MGLEKTISLPPGSILSWPAIAAGLQAEGLAISLRMIDGQPAFPDEEPDSAWQELRVSLPAGMVTLRREIDLLRLITWGNADGRLQAEWNTLARVVGEVCEQR